MAEANPSQRNMESRPIRLETTSELEPGRRIELLTYALRGGPGTCLAVSGDDSTCLTRLYRFDFGIAITGGAQVYRTNTG
jgi:hypothetical protein